MLKLQDDQHTIILNAEEICLINISLDANSIDIHYNDDYVLTLEYENINDLKNDIKLFDKFNFYKITPEYYINLKKLKIFRKNLNLIGTRGF